MSLRAFMHPTKRQIISGFYLNLLNYSSYPMPDPIFSLTIHFAANRWDYLPTEFALLRRSIGKITRYAKIETNQIYTSQPPLLHTKTKHVDIAARS